MSLWPSTIICLLLLPTVQSQAQQTNVENKPVPIDEVAMPSDEATLVANKDWSVTQAYIDVFKILSTQNTCSISMVDHARRQQYSTVWSHA